jgi:hypothetical protein
MKHYGIAALVDFARNLLPEETASSIQAHLATGCPECAEMSNFINQLTAVCRRVAVVSIPDAALRNALSILPAGFVIKPGRARRVAARLIFDSFLAPASVGLRSSWQVGWQALYRAGDCSLDLRIEPELHSSRAAMMGQISNHLVPGALMSDIPVRVKSGRLVLAEARSNQFGEFQMEYEQQNRLHLCVYLEGGARYIQVPLKRFSPGSDTATDKIKPGGTAGKKRTENSAN